MNGFIEINTDGFDFNGDSVFRLIGKDWMLIGARDGQSGEVNAMTASWGTLGVLWNKPVCIAFIRPTRYTFGMTEKSDRMSFCFFEEEYRAALRVCGTKSGRDFTDKEGGKTAAAGLTTLSDENGTPYFAEAGVVIFGKKLYADYIKKDNFIITELLQNYNEDDFHRVYICEVEKILKKQ